MVLPFKDQVGLVTGGSTGIGFATSLQIAQKGGHVVFCARDSHPQWYNGSSAERQINNDPLVQLSGGSATFFKADITKIDQINAFIQFAHQKFGQIDFAVNNAGISGIGGRIDQLEDDKLGTEKDAVYNNLFGSIHLLKAETKYFMEQGDPKKTYSIVMLSSLNGIRGCDSCDLYSASKHGIIGLVKSSALSFAKTTPRIRVNAVAPGLINTFFTRNLVKPDPDEGEAITEDHPLWLENKDLFSQDLQTGRLGEPHEIASAILFLSSKEASYISGTTLSVDGSDTAK